MKQLFEIDLNNYDPNGKVFRRPSARAVICRDDKLLMIYSQKYDYYKFPGGGIEKDEDPATALVREVREECGRKVIPESVEEFGSVMRRQKDEYDETMIFEQENFYYFCDIEDEIVETALDDYEKDEGFKAVWVDPMKASRHNLFKRKIKGADDIIVARDGRVLEIVAYEARKRAHRAKERSFVKSLGAFNGVTFTEMLQFVEAKIEKDGDTEDVAAKKKLNYSRYEHIKRVLGWAKRLYDMADNKEQLRYEEIIMAAIFHDVGRTKEKMSGVPHARAGALITKVYMKDKGFDKEVTDRVCELIDLHSNKELMQNKDIDPNLLLLMEADLLDDIGAQGIVMDCMIEKMRNENATFEDCLDHIMLYTHRIQKKMPMVTKAGIQLWEEKTALVNEFVHDLERSCCL